MNLSKLKKRLTPSFLRKQSEAEQLSAGLNQVCYEFTLESSQKLDLDAVRKIILLNPWSLADVPNIDLLDADNRNVWAISFNVLSTEKGKEIEDLIRIYLENI